ncbi:DUF7408 domain-containing protein [Halomicrobium salinisoli]|uniref:DUF7408 domain-containing protein n=1 Tax=Halomicrobium salinisoli TaxID=2878391 RepID=UPI001CEFE02D|nr:VWA domain-containing protein [Halomicrobium salinisoli]
MVLENALLDPLGLVALAALVPLVLLYLVRPDPRELALPTVEFLTEDEDDGGSNTVLRRFNRDLLFLVQALAIALVALALASPYVTDTAPRSPEETVVVLDASASMGTETGDGTRFERARRAARADVDGPTTVVVAGGGPRRLVREGGPETARRAIGDLGVTQAPGDLRRAISMAARGAQEGTHVAVYSDFAGGEGWRSAVEAARATGATVDLRQFDGGGEDNVGFVDRSVDDGRATLRVRNLGAEPATRTVELADQRRRVELEPGDVRSVTFDVPAGGGTATLSPGDSLPADDRVPVGAPGDESVDVLLLTNGDERYLRTALAVADGVSLTVERPPAAVSGDYDVVVFGNVTPDEVLDGTLATARETVADGGGVAVLAQRETGSVGYGDLLAVETGDVADEPRVDDVERHRLTDGVDFPAPEAALGGSPRDARTHVTLDDGTPLLATATRGDGRVLYLGYLANDTSFREGYRYPVFWKRAVYHLADRPRTAELNRETGATLTAGNDTEIGRPGGEAVTGAADLDRVGFYEVGGDRVGAALLDRRESNATAPDASEVADAGYERERTRTVERDLTPAVAAATVLVVLAELVVLRRRGDL